MRVLLLGTGLQGKAALFDLVRSPHVTEILAGDADAPALEAYVRTLASPKVTPVPLDATDSARLRRLMEEVDVAIELLPARFHLPVAQAAVEAGAHLVNASYASPELRRLDPLAQAAGVTILPECGLDPGIDLVLAGQVARELDEIHEFYSYGSGIPEAQAADNPLRYKISWTFEGVLRSYSRPARIVEEGRPVEVPAQAIFAPEHVHTLTVEGVGTLEAYPNGDVTGYLEAMGVAGSVRRAARYTARWPGHSAFWRVMAQLGFLADEPVDVEGALVHPRAFLRSLLEPQLQYREDERDLVFLRVEARGLKDGRPLRVVYQVVDWRDLETGMLAMQRTVGFSASIGAQMIGRGEIRKRGVLSPVTDLPGRAFLAKLAERGIRVQRWEERP